MKRRQRVGKRVMERKMSKEEYERGGSHGHGFLYPVPLFHPPVVACNTMPLGFVGGGGADGCSAVSNQFFISGCS